MDNKNIENACLDSLSGAKVFNWNLLKVSGKTNSVLDNGIKFSLILQSNSSTIKIGDMNVTNCQGQIKEIFKNETPGSSIDITSFKNQIESIVGNILNLAIEVKNQYTEKIYKMPDTIEISNYEFDKFSIKLNELTESYLINGIVKGFIKGYFDTVTIAKAINSMIISAINDLFNSDSPFELKQKWLNTIIVFVMGSLVWSGSR